MTVKFKIFYPGGNPTALIDQPIAAANRAGVAKSVMRRFPNIEQVGFVHDAPRKLAMMGGELCVNAAGAAVCLWSRQSSNRSFRFRISGFESAVSGKIHNSLTTLRLPRKIIVSSRQVPEGWLITLTGIRYLILGHQDQPNRKMVGTLIKKYRGRLPAMGVIAVSSRLSITPWVWVKQTDTLVRETACGSGSIAAAWVEHLRRRKSRYRVRQPSGEIYQIRITPNTLEFATKIKYLGMKEISYE